MLALVESEVALNSMLTFLDYNSLKNYLIAIQYSRKSCPHLFDAEIWKYRLSSRQAIDSTYLSELIPSSESNYRVSFPQIEGWKNLPLELEILYGCPEMKTYAAITTFMQCCVYFVGNGFAVSYQVKGSSVDFVVIPLLCWIALKNYRRGCYQVQRGRITQVFLLYKKAKRVHFQSKQKCRSINIAGGTCKITLWWFQSRKASLQYPFKRI